MDSKNDVYIIDSYGLIYRSYFAFITRPLVNSKNENVSAVFVDPISGKPVSNDSQKKKLMYFIKGTEPHEVCDLHKRVYIDVLDGKIAEDKINQNVISSHSGKNEENSEVKNVWGFY